MDKEIGGDDSSSSSVSYGNSSSRDMYLKQVSRHSHKISRPIRRPSPIPSTASTSSPAIPHFDPNSGQAKPQSQQPTVYNINKNDFRDVVQRLTGSPAHERQSAPTPPAAQIRQSSSRLQRIRPPPLAQIGNRPPQMNQVLPHPQNDAVFRPAQTFTQPPPMFSANPAAESPISAYMRFLQNSTSSSVPSPLWNGGVPIGQRPDSLPPQNDGDQRLLPPQSSIPPPPLNGVAPPRHPPTVPSLQQQPHLPSSAASPPPFPVMPSPLPFGYGPFPMSPYGNLFSPTGQLGLPHLPLSPTFPPYLAQSGNRPPQINQSHPQSSQFPPLESPVSAYMRFLQNSASSAAPPPLYSGAPPHNPQIAPSQQRPNFSSAAAPPSPFPVLPLSPPPFGCIPSPRSPYGTLFSPAGQLGLPQVPLWPTLPVPSPRWKGM